MGCSRSYFEARCEEKYNEYLQHAIRQIERGEYPDCPWITVELYGGYVDFPSYEAHLIVDSINLKLKNAIDEYKLKYKTKEIEEEAARERRKEAKRAQELAKRQQEEENERREMELERQRREEEERLREEQKAKSLKTLMNTPYDMSQDEALKFINDDGTINQSKLTQFSNDKRNQEYIAKKTAAWEASKVKAEKLTIQNTIVCPSCGFTAGASDRFCRGCGAQLQKECPSCKKLMPAGNSFCTECGSKL